jgi:hypothetical protein
MHGKLMLVVSWCFAVEQLLGHGRGGVGASAVFTFLAELLPAHARWAANQDVITLVEFHCIMPVIKVMVELQ